MARVGVSMTGLPTVRTSERSAFHRCPQQWYWKYRMGLVPKGAADDNLWLGIGVHEALAQWYKKGKRRGIHPGDYFAGWAADEVRYIRTVTEDEDALVKYEDAKELGIEMLYGYIEEYGKDPSWDVIATEHPFSVRVTSGGQPVANFASAWDGVYRDLEDGYIYLMEHKTANQISTPYLEMDPQGGAYWAVASQVLRAQGVLKAGEVIAGITYNFLRKAIPDDRPRDEQGRYLNKDGTVSKRQGTPRFVRHLVERTPGEMRQELQDLANEVAWMHAIKSGQLPILKSRTRDCPWCPFWDMCKLHQHGGDSWRELLSDYDQVDPYEERRKAAL